MTQELKQLLEPAKYFPIKNGLYEVKPGLLSLNLDLGNGKRDSQIFQIDSHFNHYQKIKSQSRKENLSKYYQAKNLPKETKNVVTQFMLKQLVSEYPEYFKLTLNAKTKISKFECKLTNEALLFNKNNNLLEISKKNNSKDKVNYIDSLDAIACQIQEDFTIINLENEKDWNSAIHLCYPNHWSPEDKIGKNFIDTHIPVPAMEKINNSSRKLIDAMVYKGPYLRFAWGLSTDTKLNHHPMAPKNVNKKEWRGRLFDINKPELYIRLERQTLIGFPKEKAILFTIRTYFRDCSKLTQSEKGKVVSAIESMSNEQLDYKGLTKSKNEIIYWLKQK